VFSIAASVSLSWSLAILFAGYSYKSYVSYSSKKTAYTLRLTRSLYYQVIDSNAGVFFRLLDEAEEQEVREALLAYYYLWKFADGRALTPEALDDAVEEDIEKRLGIKIDFEVLDALGKLEALKLVIRENDAFRALPMHEALTAVEEAAPAVESRQHSEMADQLATSRP
jgi:hypothetical protein